MTGSAEKARYCRKLTSSTSNLVKFLPLANLLRNLFGLIRRHWDIALFFKGKLSTNQARTGYVVPRYAKMAANHGGWHICHDLVMAERRLRSAKLCKSWLGDTAGWLWEAAWCFFLGRIDGKTSYSALMEMYGHVGKRCKLVCSLEMFIVCPRLFHFPVPNWHNISKIRWQKRRSKIQ